MKGKDKAKVIRQFVRALEAVGQHEPDTPEIEAAAKEAERLLLDNWDLIERFPLEHRLDHSLNSKFDRLEELVTNRDRGYILSWKHIRDDLIKPTVSGKSFVGELKRWADELEGEMEGDSGEGTPLGKSGPVPARNKNIKSTAALIMRADTDNRIKGPKDLHEAIITQLGEDATTYNYVKNKLWPALKPKNLS